MNPKIIISILLLSLLFIGYYFLNKKTTKKDLQPPGNAKKEPNQPDFCFGDIFPSISCDSNTVICDPILKRWRCKLDCENPETNPFPTDFQKCNITDIKCDSNGNYYCDNNYCKNGGKLYNNSSDQCSCPEEYTGKTCEILKSICHNGNSDPDDPTKCSTCCDKTTSIGGKCRHYNGPQKTCENDCDAEKKNSVYDGTKCSCPGGFIEDGTGCKATPDICNSDGTVQENGNNKIGSNGLCECKVGWEGPICQTNKCGDHGTYNTTTLTCDCENGWSGNRCQYSRDSCSNHGDPQVNDKGEFIKCKCDEGWKGNKCTCELAAKPTEDDLYHTCRGIYSECTDNGWKQTCKNCEGIYSYFGDENKWREQCNSSIVTEVKGSSSYTDDGWIAKCSPQSDCDDSLKFSAERTCNSTPTDSDLANCKREDTYIPWTDPNYKPGEYAKISAGKTNVCVCSEEEVSGKGLYPVWKPVPITDDKRCGPMPPKGLCKSGDVVVDPHCIAPLGVNGTRAWLCPGQTLPKDIVEEVWPSLKAHELNNNKYYYTTKNGDSFNTIYPTINMDQCYNAPYDQLTSISDFGPGYQTLNSEPGFVKGLSKDNQSGTFISINQARLPNSGVILFNQGITDNTRIDGKSFDDFSKKFSNINSISSSEYIGKKITNAEKIGGGDYYNKFMVENNVNCAKERSTDIGSQCMNKGTPVQICSDSNFNIVSCNDPSTYYRYDKVLCGCGTTYISNADGTVKSYKGDRCQYSDNTTCNGKGIVQDDGTCVCNDDYKGDQCQYSDKDTCSGRGKVKSDGSCFCYPDLQGVIQGIYSTYPLINNPYGSGWLLSREQNNYFEKNFDNLNFKEFYKLMPLMGQVLGDYTFRCFFSVLLGKPGSISVDYKFNVDGNTFIKPNIIANTSDNSFDYLSFLNSIKIRFENNQIIFKYNNGNYSDNSLIGDIIFERSDPERFPYQYQGNNCQYDNSYCNNNGTLIIDKDGNLKCSCSSGFAGDKCQYSASSQCNGRGTVKDDGTCQCNDGYAGDHCDKCAPGRGPAYPDCNAFWATKQRLTNNCPYNTKDLNNCANDPNITAITNRGNNWENGSGPFSTIQGVCNNSYGGGCKCLGGHNRMLCNVTGYFYPTEVNDRLDNCDYHRDPDSYSCIGSS
jgi:hypothetical protein